jgi:hypothetical protein
VALFLWQKNVLRAFDCESGNDSKKRVQIAPERPANRETNLSHHPIVKERVKREAGTGSRKLVCGDLARLIVASGGDTPSVPRHVR